MLQPELSTLPRHNVLVPVDAPMGSSVELVLTIGGVSSRAGVTLAVK
jgi:uncharacterized protein (TIGR03437 family)